MCDRNNTTITYNDILEFAERHGGVSMAINTSPMYNEGEVRPLVGAPVQWDQRDEEHNALDVLHAAQEFLDELCAELYEMAWYRLYMDEEHYDQYPDEDDIDAVRRETGKIIAQFIRDDDNPVESLPELLTLIAFPGYGFGGYSIDRDGTKFIAVDIEDVVTSYAESTDGTECTACGVTHVLWELPGSTTISSREPVTEDRARCLLCGT